MNGTLCPGPDGTLHLFVGRGHFRIDAVDLRKLLAGGRVVPVTMDERETAADGTVTGHFIVPLVSVQRVVRGEAASAPLFPLVPEGCP